METTDPSFWIRQLGLSRHPEGGWFAESYRSAGIIPAGALPPSFQGPRCFATAIHFLLEQDDFSALHRLASDETWHFYEGAPLTVHIIAPDGEYCRILLGRTPARGELFQATVPAGCWFGAETTGPFSLVGCTVAPGFDFDDFELARRGDLSARFPPHAGLIDRLTRSGT